MPFRPINDRHAIQEVVFVLTFSRHFNADEMERFVNAHERWQAELPTLSRDQVLSVMLSSGSGREVELPVSGASFDRFKADGSRAWRLRATDNWLAVNCLAYTRWADIWAHARELLHRGSDALSSEDNPVTGLALQYINVFVWEGDSAQYDVGELFRGDSEYLPTSFWGKGPLWHLHQGWFREEGLPDGGRRLLERVHLDARLENELHVVKFDSTRRLDLAEGVASPRLFEGEDAPIEEVFEKLHIHNKHAMVGYLCDQMIERIGLNV